MADPLDSPPADHGSDRYDYVEVQGPADIAPAGEWFTQLLKEACPDCRANVFLRFIDGKYEPLKGPHPHWDVTIAHDDTCPTPEIP